MGGPSSISTSKLIKVYRSSFDSGLSTEDVRERLKRSILKQPHERGSFLHLRGIKDLVNPLIRGRFPQPRITVPFENPVVRTYM